jgi:hypothetical protein
MLPRCVFVPIPLNWVLVLDKEEWLRGLDSNQDNQLQRLACYQLHYPGPVEFQKVYWFSAAAATETSAKQKIAGRRDARGYTSHDRKVCAPAALDKEGLWQLRQAR